jgi:hypothetical protein
VEGALKVGLPTIHFQSADQTKRELVKAKVI